ncbi:hypothetical protein [Flavobacterium sp. 22076]|uniref:hypothetical protein n=1 Tax=unclassified Flavobacterium TaxID=196869 RepID=UPI003F84B4A8
MRLVAVYIKKHELLFNNETINFGGKYIYSFNEIDKKNLEISRIRNTKFIKKFWGRNISLVSAVVGANGTGKTSLLSIINRSYKDKTNFLFIYESIRDNKTHYLTKIFNEEQSNSLSKKDYKINVISQDFELNEIEDSPFTELYYSPIFDERVLDFYSPLRLNSDDSNNTLNDIFRRNLLNENIFLNSKTSDIIKSIYEDFPIYEFNIISANRLNKRDLRKVYIDTNIGYANVLKKFRNDMQWEFQKIKDEINSGKHQDIEGLKISMQYIDYVLKVTDKDFLFNMFDIILNNVFNDEQIEEKFKEIFKKDEDIDSKIVINESLSVDRIDYSDLDHDQRLHFRTNLNSLKNLSMVDMLDVIWDDYPNNVPESNHLLHSNDNLIKDLEVNILSLLVLKDVYAINGLQGSYDSLKIIEEKRFEVRLNHFLKKFIVQKHVNLYNKIIRDLGEDFNVLIAKNEIIKIIREDKFSQEIGVNTLKIKEDIINIVEVFYDIIEFYNFIKTLVKNNETSLEIKIKEENSIDNLNLFFKKYEPLSKYFSELSLRDTDIIHVKSNKKFSYGEKMLLNLYSVLYEFSLTRKNVKKNYLLLLDEADLGYHALWKKNTYMQLQKRYL